MEIESKYIKIAALREDREKMLQEEKHRYKKPQKPSTSEIRIIKEGESLPKKSSK